MIRGGGEGIAGKEIVASPMPGKVMNLLVDIGQEVKADQGLIAIEDMKMENEFRSTSSGRIKEIFVKEGEVVESGAKLLLVE